jgi:hypothetical protein
MKNEVKKKMMIERHWLPHESHTERVSDTKVNKSFEDCIESQMFFVVRHAVTRVEHAGSTRPQRSGPTAPVPQCAHSAHTL